MTLGEKLHNPGNIEREAGQVWKGQSPDQPDPTFVSFLTDADGLEAIVKTLRTYQRKGITTIAGAITRWAPPSKNNTAAYIEDECEHCNASPGSPFMRMLLPFIRGLITHEQGRCLYTDAQIQAAIDAVEGPTMSTPQPATMAQVMAHPATKNVISGAAAAGFIGAELTKFHLYDMSGAETVALGILLSILSHRFFPQGLPTE